MEIVHGIYVPTFDSYGNQMVVVEPRSDIKTNIFSHNWCDKCSWYQGSVKATNEVLADSGNGLTFNSDHDFWIDLTHGRLTDEDRLVATSEAGSNWIPTVKVNDVEQSSGYTINYESGDVTFSSSQSGNTVKATYWYAGNGDFTVSAAADKIFEILRVEIQFSKNIVLNDTMVFTPMGYAGVFAPQLVPGTYAPTDIIQIDYPNKYKGPKDYLNESNGSFPVVPAFGGLNNDVLILVWDYLSRTNIVGNYGMRIVLGTENNNAHTGEIATATFYGVTRNA